MKETLKVLIQAFIGESQARNRYHFYSSQAKKEGFQQIAALFKLTSDNEKEHAKRLFEHIQELKEDLDGAVLDVKAPLSLGNTIENLKSAIKGENYEHTIMYPEFAEIAMREGYPKIAARLRAIAKAEVHHEERYKKLLEQLEAGTLFRKDEKKEWVCRECGYVHTGRMPPDKCPSCDHDKGYYELKCEEY
jgi:rubrerythrin